MFRLSVMRIVAFVAGLVLANGGLFAQTRDLGETNPWPGNRNVISLPIRNPLPSDTHEFLIDTDFESDPLLEGWSSTTPVHPQGNLWTDEEAFSPVHSIRAVEGYWYSPSIPIEPFKMYAVTFLAHSNQEGFAGVLSNVDFLYEGSATWNVNPFLFRGEVGESVTNVLFLPPGTGAAYFDDVTVEEVDGEDAALVLDQMFQEMEMPLYTFSAPSGRHAHLTNAIGKLKNAEVLRVVMLGDSIVKDISHSYFEALVERLYPGASVEIVTSALSSTGCWWYRDLQGIYFPPVSRETPLLRELIQDFIR